MVGMRSLADLTGVDLRWSFDTSSVIPEAGDRHYVLFSGQEAVVTAQASWLRMDHFDVVMEAGEGSWFVHLDLKTAGRDGVVWKAGERTSQAGFRLTHDASIRLGDFNMAHDGSLIVTGAISCASGRQLEWRTKTLNGAISGGYELVSSEDEVLLYIQAAVGKTTAGTMHIDASLATNAELPALVALAFALANEQALMLHGVRYSAAREGGASGRGQQAQGETVTTTRQVHALTGWTAALMLSAMFAFWGTIILSMLGVPVLIRLGGSWWMGVGGLALSIFVASMTRYGWRMYKVRKAIEKMQKTPG